MADDLAPGRLVLAGPVSLSGRYGTLGRLAADGLRQVVEDAASAGGVRVGGRMLIPVVVLLDDESTREGVRRRLDAIGSADVIVGPYGSDLVREAATWAAANSRIVWNHGASADDVERSAAVVSVASPASRYHEAVLEAIARQLPGADVLVGSGHGRFGRWVAEGAVETANRLGLSVVDVVKPTEISAAPGVDVLLLAGSFEQDVAAIRRLRSRPTAVAAVAGALGAFANELGGGAEGVIAPSQWEEGLRFASDVGPTQADVVRALRARITPKFSVGARPGCVDYPAAQAYACGLLAIHCASVADRLDDETLAATARQLRCTTFFGHFGVGADGRQLDHQVVVVQWQGGVKRVVWPPASAETTMTI